MNKYLILFIFVLIRQISIQAQTTTVFQDNFDSPSPTWVLGSVSGENTWNIGACAGNGGYFAGDSAAYISNGSSIACGLDYNAVPAATNNSIILSHTVDAACVSGNLSLQFDYKSTINAGSIFEIVYSTDGGGTWTSLSVLSNQSAWFTSFSNTLPISLAGTSFELGFRFTYDNTPIGAALPPAVDNIVVRGDDTIPPTMICPASDTIHSDPYICEVGLEKMNSSLISVSDNCTAVSALVFSQNPPQNYLLSGNLDSVLVTVTVQDEAGNQNSCNINVVMVDVTPPTPICPSDTIQLLDLNCTSTLDDYTNYVQTHSSDNCGINSVSQLPLPGTNVSDDGTLQAIKLTVIDVAGNSANCIFNVKLVDSIPPQLNCPDSVPMYVNSSCVGVVPDYTNYIANYAAHDSCSSPGTITASQDLTPGNFLSSNQFITYTVKDAHGNPSTCQVMLVLTDTIQPQIICAASSYEINPVSGCSAPLPDYTVSAPPITSDNCSGVSISQNPSPGTIISGINNHVYLIATDAAGNKDSCSFVVNIKDTISPSIICPNDTLLSSNQYCQGSLIDFTYLVSMNDNCTDTFSLSQNFTQNPVAGTTITGSLPITVTLKATDNTGNSSNCILHVALADFTPPTIDSMAPLSGISNASSCDFSLPDYTSTATAHDNCTADGFIVLNQIPPAGTILSGPGTYTISIIAEDQAGNKDTLDVPLTVNDTVPPTLSACPGTQTMYATSSCASAITDFSGLVTINDNCTAMGNLIVTQTPPASSTIGADTTVTITVTDESGNVGNVCSFGIQFIDTIAPQINCITDTIIAVDATCSYTVPNLINAMQASDNCDTNPSFSQSPLAGTNASDTTLVTLTAQDASGNSTTCIVAVLPTVPPVNIATCVVNQNISTASCNATLADYTGFVTVNAPCGGAMLTQIPSAGTVLNTGNHTIFIIATDGANNKDSCSFNLQISESTPPNITCPNDTTSCKPQISYIAPIGTDNCVAVTTQTDGTGFSSGSVFPIGTTTLAYTVKDSSGNTATCTFNVNILDYPDTAKTMPDTVICGTNSFIISAISPSSGTGQWSVTNGGSATLNNNFANTTGVNNLQIGNNTFVWTIQTTSCGSTEDTLVIRLDEMPNPPASTIDTMQACQDSIVSIVANTPNVGFGYWHDPTGHAAFTDSTSVSTTVGHLSSGWNEIIWTIGNGVCPTSSDTIHLFANQTATILSNFDSINPICLNENTVTVSGIPAVNGFNSFWYISEGNGDISFPTASQTSIKNLGVGINVIKYKMTGVYCNPSADSIIIIVENCNALGSDFPTMITPNDDGRNDLWVLDNLNAAYPQCKVDIFDQWGNSVYKSTGYLVPWDGKFKGKPLPMGTYFYVIETNGSENKILKGNISIIH
jgi:gliding motility-associated-like protein